MLFNRTCHKHIQLNIEHVLTSVLYTSQILLCNQFDLVMFVLVYKSPRFFGSSDPCMVKIPNVLVFLTGLLHSIASEAVVRLPEFKPGELSKTAWAYATCGFREGGSSKHLAVDRDSQEIVITQGTCNLFGICIWSFASLHLSSELSCS